LLSNPVIEDYELQDVGVGDREKTPNVEGPTSRAQLKKPKTKKPR
jgi:hypothetical protein